MKFAIQCVGAVVLATLLCSAANAQGRGRTYTPARPTITPYLDYFRSNNGVLNNYYGYIRPRQQLTEALSQQTAAIEQNAKQLGALKLNVNQLQAVRESEISPTGHGATFMNYSHYYPAQNQGGGRR